LMNNQVQIRVIDEISDAVFENGIMNVYHIDCENAEEINFGEISAKAGDLAFRSVTTAIDLAMKKLVDGTVTGPIHKESINLAGHKFAGHTEIYAHYTGTKKYAMLLVEHNFKVIHVSTHVSLRQACDLVKKDRVLEVIHLMNNGLKSLKIANPRIGVAGLNPHASDGGLFGNEDTDEILPAIEQARKEGVIVDGPVPPDTLFAMAYGGKYDGCVAMYHDQGHIPFKVIGFNWDQETKKMKSVKGVNITMGLPIIRTSVDHGTAFEIAGKGVASPDALFNALEYAEKLLN
jgi:4-phospho-D-threonate 3-dehydrogenase / 4-phospho-D-erythronate 3-dehydrogenase